MALMAGLIAEIKNHECYHPQLKNADQVLPTILMTSNQNGSYMIRNSFSRKNVYTISMLHFGTLRHFNITILPMTLYLDEEVQFSSLIDLLAHYTRNDVPNIERVGSVRFKYPVINPYQKRQSQPNRPTSGQVVGPSGRVLTRSMTEMPASENIQLPTAKPKTNLKAKIGQFVKRKSESSITPPTSPTYDSPPVAPRPLHTLDERPPVPLPRHPFLPDPPEDPYADADSIYFDVYADFPKDMLGALKEQEKEDAPKCECGLYMHHAELPQGWTMHISQDEGTKGRLFFLSAERKTMWNLPPDIACDLNSRQQELIKTLLKDQPTDGSASVPTYH